MGLKCELVLTTDQGEGPIIHAKRLGLNRKTVGNPLAAVFKHGMVRFILWEAHSVNMKPE